MRALFVAMDKWVSEGVGPPASSIPRLADGTLVKAADVAFPAIPDVQSPRTLTAGSRAANPFLAGGAGAGTPLPLLVPQVDAGRQRASGHQAAGSRRPAGHLHRLELPQCGDRRHEPARPVAGLVYSVGARTRAEREARHDPRPSIEERYASRQQYLDAIDKAAAALVKGGYLLAGDVPSVVKRATEHWDLATHEARN